MLHPRVGGEDNLQESGQGQPPYDLPEQEEKSHDTHGEERDLGEKSGDQVVRINKRTRHVKRDEGFHYY